MEESLKDFAAAVRGMDRSKQRALWKEVLPRMEAYAEGRYLAYADARDSGHVPQEYLETMKKLAYTAYSRVNDVNADLALIRTRKRTIWERHGASVDVEDVLACYPFKYGVSIRKLYEDAEAEAEGNAADFRRLAENLH